MDQYVLYRDNRNQWRWRYVHRNGNIIADSGESYVNKSDAINGINIMKASANIGVYES